MGSRPDPGRIPKAAFTLLTCRHELLSLDLRSFLTRGTRRGPRILYETPIAPEYAGSAHLCLTILTSHRSVWRGSIATWQSAPRFGWTIFPPAAVPQRRYYAASLIGEREKLPLLEFALGDPVHMEGVHNAGHQRARYGRRAALDR